MQQILPPIFAVYSPSVVIQNKRQLSRTLLLFLFQPLIYCDVALNIHPIIFFFVSHGFKERIVKSWLANFKVHVHPLLPPRTLEQVRKNRGKNQKLRCIFIKGKFGCNLWPLDAVDILLTFKINCPDQCFLKKNNKINAKS